VVAAHRTIDWREIDTELCAIHRTLAVIGEKWTILVIRDAANGVRRFDDFRRHVGLSEAVLSDRLKRLVTEGIFETREYQEPGQRRRNEYRLTAKGWDLLPALIALMQWGDAHAIEPGDQAWVLEHAECGHPVRAEVRCSHDGAKVGPRDTRLVAGPGLAASTAAKTRTKL
jgi:DNA-binding HxlR family transcriptional regulator